MKILIDTSFILPALGIDVGESVLNLIKEFDKHEIYYTELSLLEAMWIIRRLLKEGNNVDFKIVRTGLKSVFKTYHLLKIPISAYINAVNDRRHNDLIDMIIYYTAKAYNLKFLSLDKRLKELDKENIVIDKL
ncbi:PIN domain-containing protein [Acidianus ambivalens]|uniref:PIN domain-containing protein n=1 Tax=Acidianus ambivalens TaxID=2283 RepID=A0A650CVU1_ACIAM|nr:PIN domain-containing protein [Acidianus ambivalens]MQL56386.1 PIN domain-containing protein [Acidianus ambivalens]QGR21991.1 PIN domain-containing protein [Acidianus ambivalens]